MAIPTPRVRLTVGAKLVSLIGVLLISSIATLVYLSTRMFVEDNTSLIQQTNMDKAASLSLQVRETFATLAEKTRILGTVLLQNSAQPEAKRQLIQEFFAKDPDFLGVFLYQRGEDQKFKIASQAVPPDWSAADADALQVALQGEREFSVEQVGRGENLLTLTKLPDGGVAIAMSVPFVPAPKPADGFTHTLSAVIRQKKFTALFDEGAVTTSYLVDRKGRLLAHPDASRVAAGENVSSVEIVKQLLSGKSDNGQTRFMDPATKEYRLGAFRIVGFGGLGVVTEVPEAKAYEVARSIEYRAMLIAGIIVCLAFLGGYLFSRTITWPIRLLVEASHRISEGDFKINLNPKGTDEVAHLSLAFNEMAKGLEERDKVKATFAKFHSKEVADKVLSGELNLGGERKHATVFFSDVRGFTSMGERMDPEALVKVLNRYMSRMVHVILEHGGIVDKYVGDAIMAVWGVPLAKEGDVERALRACLGMRQALAELNEEFAREGLPPLKIGMGLNYGSLVSGNIGSDERMEFTVIGDTVNTASRIESLTKEFGTDLLVSREVLDQVPGKFIAEKAHEAKVKGKADALAVFRVLGYVDENGQRVIVQTPYSSYKAEKSDKVVHDSAPKAPPVSPPGLENTPHPLLRPLPPPGPGSRTNIPKPPRPPGPPRPPSQQLEPRAQATPPPPPTPPPAPGQTKTDTTLPPFPEVTRTISRPIIRPVRKAG